MIPTVLIVEDSALLAIALAQALKTASFDIVGPAATVDQALSLIAQKGCDAAVLDINLRGETSEPIARELRTRGIPFVTLTGYAQEQLQPDFAGAPAFSKPVRAEALIVELRRCLERRAS